MASTTVVQIVHKGKQGGGRRVRKRTRIATRSVFCALTLVLPLFNLNEGMFGAKLCQGILLALLYGMLITDGWMRYHRKEDSSESENGNIEVSSVECLSSPLLIK